jgi:hypothetical protein
VTSLREGDAYETAGGGVSASSSLSEAVDPSSDPPASLNLVGLGPQVRAAAPPDVETEPDLGAGLPVSRAAQPRAYLHALERCRQAWARTEDQLSLEVWPA